MHSETNLTMMISPRSEQTTMADPRQYRAGDKFVLPVQFQLLKALGCEDRVYYLCAPINDTKQVMCLQDPFFVLCLEPGDDKPDMPGEVLERACKIARRPPNADEGKHEAPGE